jgi:hypothetical protein
MNAERRLEVLAGQFSIEANETSAEYSVTLPERLDVDSEWTVRR